MGTNPLQTVRLPNRHFGIWLEDNSTSNTIGYADLRNVKRNYIYYNSGGGVGIADSTSNTLSANYIVANLGHGVRLEDGTRKITIGGALADQGNIIVANGLDGVNVHGGGTVENTITRNSIYSNTLRGIRIENGGNAT